VSIAIDDTIEEFATYEKANNDRLSGGHLLVQIRRFERLWRIHFFIDEEVWRGLPADKIESLRQAIKIMLSVDPPAVLDAMVRQLAKSIAFDEGRAGRNSTTYIDDLPEVARSDETVAVRPTYPNGAPCLRNFLKKTE
jgi:hypothetical protein